ncbi:MAG: hypothetical protein P8Y71_08930 [Pseudolabrys sp.]|jgi:hypothetical protein
MNKKTIGRSPGLYVLAAGVILGVVALTTPSLAAGERTFAPDGQFSILFAAKATARKTSAGNVVTQTWTGKGDNIYYGVSQSSSSVPLDPPKELATNFTNFIAEVRGHIIKQERRSWPAPNGPVPALRFEFRLPKGQIGKGVFVVKGGTVFGAVAVDYTSPAREKRLSAVVDSLTLLK